jgi:hypothetical protein
MADKPPPKGEEKQRRFTRLKSNKFCAAKRRAAAHKSYQEKSAPLKYTGDVRDTLYEMLMHWRTPKHPMQTQLLTFRAAEGFSAAYKEAQRIASLLRSVGNFKESDMSLEAVASAGCLKQHFAMQRLYTSGKAKDMSDLIKSKQKNLTNKSVSEDTDSVIVATRGGSTPKRKVK